jgi:hypothetical protein
VYALTRVILLTVVVAVTLTGCAGEGPRLLVGEDPETGETARIGVALPDIVAGRPYSLGGWIMCLDRPGTVTIERIDLLRPSGGIVLQTFSSRPQGPDMIGNAEESLTAIGFPARNPDVTTACEQDGPLTELGLQYGKSGDASAHAEGIRLTYTSAGRQRTVDFALDVRLCAPGDMSTKQCADMYDEVEKQRKLEE